MSINPDETYDNFIYADDVIKYVEQDLMTWNIERKMSGDLVAGLFIALSMLIDFMKNNGNIPGGHRGVELFLDDGTESFFFHFGQTEMEAQTHYNLSMGAEEFTDIDDIIFGFRVPSPLEDMFGWWISTGNGDRDFFYLYTFRTPEFIQGFISMCDAFNVDFRDFILGNPFKINNGVRTDYNIEGYDIEPIPRFRRPAAVAPFYTERNEADPGAVDYM